MKNFNLRLITWYQSHKRSLPWRDTQDPYLIWISEIILQQTRVAQGYEYFMRFVQRFPTLQSLASASEDEVLKYWQGLGYYTRARNLHAAARSMGDTFPLDYAGVRALKGVGDYTAAAVCSFAYNLPHAVVDGNVYRVLARLFGLDYPIDELSGKKKFAQLAQTLLDKKNPATYNQAIMEFGALQCVPSSPDCQVCPFVKDCMAHREGRVADLPVKKHKTKTRNRYFNYLYIDCGTYTWLHKRTGKDIWTNLYELPLVETDKPISAKALLQFPAYQYLCGTVPPSLLGSPVKHVLSHQIIYASFYRVMLPAKFKLPLEFTRVLKRNISKYAVPRLIHSFLSMMLQYT